MAGFPNSRGRQVVLALVQTVDYQNSSSEHH